MCLLRLLLLDQLSGLGVPLRLHLALLLNGLLLLGLLLLGLRFDQRPLLSPGLAPLLGNTSLRSDTLSGKAIGLCLASCRFRSSLLLGLLLLFAGSSSAAHGQTPMLRPAPAVAATEPGAIFRLSLSGFLGLAGSVI